MPALTERGAERYLAARALSPAYPGFVGLALEMPLAAPGPEQRSALRHGFRTVRDGRLVVSGPPSPGLDIAIDRMRQDLETAGLGPGHGGAPAEPGVRVSLEAGTDDTGPGGLRRRWAVAHAVAPVLVAAFANRPAPGSGATIWRTARRVVAPIGHEPDPRTAWARYVLDAPVSTSGPGPVSFRQWIRHPGGPAPAVADLDGHARSLRPVVAARGHLEIAVTDGLPGTGWTAAAAVIAVLIDDPWAAAEALTATAELHNTPQLWERAARDALSDPQLATAARSLFLSAYTALARQGAPRPVRDAVAAYLDRFVLPGRSPADDLLDLGS